MSALLNIKDLTVTYHVDGLNRVALNKLNVSIEHGEILALLGETGSGKSTVGLSIMGLLPKNAECAPSSSIQFEDKTILPLSPNGLKSVRGKGISIVFQNPLEAMNPALRCGYQVMEALRTHQGITKTPGRKKVLALFKSLELSDPKRMYRSYPHQVSIGQLQRINIAMALIMKPGLLIADEPFSSIDAVNQIGLARLLKKINQEMGTSILLITHNLSLTNICAERWQVLYRGEIVDQGRGSILNARPVHDYTKKLIQSHLNLVKGGRYSSKESQVFLRCNSVSFSFKRQNIFSNKNQKTLDQISFELEKGKALGIVGKSGSGKSTLSQIIGGLLTGYTGSVFIDGKDIKSMVDTDAKEHFRNVQYILQDAPSSLPPRRQIYQILSETIKAFYNHKTKKECIQEAGKLLQEVQLDDNYLYRYPAELSGGEKQRICIARALAVQAKLLILDESLNSLDKHIQSKIIGLLKELRTRKRLTMILVAHEIPLVYYFCERIIILEKGRIVESGWTHEVIHEPQSGVAKMLIQAGL